MEGIRIGLLGLESLECRGTAHGNGHGGLKSSLVEAEALALHVATTFCLLVQLSS